MFIPNTFTPTGGSALSFNSGFFSAREFVEIAERSRTLYYETIGGSRYDVLGTAVAPPLPGTVTFRVLFTPSSAPRGVADEAQFRLQHMYLSYKGKTGVLALARSNFGATSPAVSNGVACTARMVEVRSTPPFQTGTQTCTFFTFVFEQEDTFS